MNNLAARKKRIIVFAVVFLTLLLFLEIFLRYYWGFCDMVLAQESDKYEYSAQPNQNRFRIRKHVRYNQFSMRSEELKESDSIRILGFGDSVINGELLVDQDSLATSIIEKELTKEAGFPVRCLNVSYGSWGPDNCFAYLKEHGDFNADLIFLLISSHDAFDNMNFQKIVDESPRYPSKQYPFAIYELFDRYIIPHLIKTGNDIDPVNRSTEFNSGFSSFQNYVQEKEIPFFIYLHPEKIELQNKKYNAMGDTIIRFCENNNIPLIQGLNHELPTGYHDNIHLNEKGQNKLADILLPEIKKYVFNK